MLVRFADEEVSWVHATQSSYHRLVYPSSDNLLGLSPD
jgi:hypothetical protein